MTNARKDVLFKDLTDYQKDLVRRDLSGEGIATSQEQQDDQVILLNINYMLEIFSSPQYEKIPLQNEDLAAYWYAKEFRSCMSAQQDDTIKNAKIALLTYVFALSEFAVRTTRSTDLDSESDAKIYSYLQGTINIKKTFQDLQEVFHELCKLEVTYYLRNHLKKSTFLQGLAGVRLLVASESNNEIKQIVGLGSIQSYKNLKTLIGKNIKDTEVKNFMETLKTDLGVFEDIFNNPTATSEPDILNAAKSNLLKTLQNYPSSFSQYSNYNEIKQVLAFLGNLILGLCTLGIAHGIKYSKTGHFGLFLAEKESHVHQVYSEVDAMEQKVPEQKR